MWLQTKSQDHQEITEMKIGQISEGEGESLNMTMKEETGFQRTADLLHMREKMCQQKEKVSCQEEGIT